MILLSRAAFFGESRQGSRLAQNCLAVVYCYSRSHGAAIWSHLRPGGFSSAWACVFLSILLVSGFGRCERAAADSAERLFADHAVVLEPQSDALLSADPITKRSRTAYLNASLWDANRPAEAWAMSKLTLDLFPDVQPTVVIARTESLETRRWVAQGFIEGQPNSQFIMAVNGGFIAATVFMPGHGTYRIAPAGNKICTISEIDSNRLGACGSDDVRPAAGVSKPVRKTLPMGGPTKLLSIPPAAGPGTNVVTVVNVMVVYTPEARQGAGGAEAMNTLIDLAVAEANTVYQNSAVKARLRLVYRGETDYVEATSFSTNLDRLKLKNDGFMDDVHALRDTNKANVVCLITEHADPGVAGKAFTMTELSPEFKAEAFSVVQRAQAVGTFIFAHEISHNFGCQHDRENAIGPDGTISPGAFPYSFGYRFEVNGVTYRTVMAYAPGQPIPFLSNPDISFLGVPTGLPGKTNGANNALTINNTAALVGSFYGLPLQTPPPSVALTNPISGAVLHSGTNLALTALAGDTDGTVVQVVFFAENTFLGVVTNALASGTNALVPRTNVFTLNWPNLPAGEFRLTALAFDRLGATSASIPVNITVRPTNDDFASRLVISGANPSVSGTTRAATLEPGEAMHAGNPGGRSVWYVWTAPKSGTVLLTASGLGITPLVDVYKSVTANALTTIARDFDFDKTNLETRTTFDVVAGETYSIALDALGGDSGDFTFDLQFEPPPANDNYVNRIQLSGDSISLTATNVAATTEPGEPVHAGNPGGKSVWFGWEAPKSGTAIVTVSATNFFPLVDVYLPSASAQVPTNGPSRTLAFDQTNKTVTVSWDAAAGQSYALVVDGFLGLAGTFNLSLEYAPPPPNDNFTNRISLAGTRVNLKSANLYATREPGEPFHDGFKDDKSQGRRSVWYSWIAPVSGPVTVTSRGEGFYPLLDVYTGDALNSLTNVPRRTVSFSTTNTVSTLTFTALAFQTYALAVDGFEGRSGAFTFDLATEFSVPTAQLLSISEPPPATIRLRLFGSAGQNFVIQAATNLVDWADVFMGSFVATNTTTFTDANSGKFSYRFYRVLSLP